MSARIQIKIALGAVIAILAVGIIAAATSPSASSNTNMMEGKAPASMPPGKAYLDGQDIYFIHTEVSDADVAKVLSGWMNSPVIHVPALSQVPAAALADVYVFKNGVKGMGPLGFQPDVFDNPLIVIRRIPCSHATPTTGLPCANCASRYCRRFPTAPTHR